MESKERVMDEFNKLVTKERLAQDNKWGEQNHDPAWWLAILAEEVGELSKAILETEQGDIYADTKDIETELTHVGAVAKAMWESGKRNKWL